MTPNDIVMLIAIIAGGAVLLWVNIRIRKDNLSEDFK